MGKYESCYWKKIYPAKWCEGRRPTGEICNWHYTCFQYNKLQDNVTADGIYKICPECREGKKGQWNLSKHPDRDCSCCYYEYGRRRLSNITVRDRLNELQ